MNNYKRVILEWNQNNVLKEDALTGAAVGMGIGGLAYAFNEWLMHWIKELRNTILTASTPEEVKNWYDTNIVDDDAIYWTRKGYLKMDYFSRAIGLMVERQDPQWKEKLLKRCNKSIFLGRAAAIALGAVYGLQGAMIAS